MPKYEPYPKVMSKGKGEDVQSEVARNADEEAALRKEGFTGPKTLSADEARETVETDVPKLEFPKLLFKGADAEREEVVVKDADEEAAQRAQGFGHVSDAKKSKGKKSAE